MSQQLYQFSADKLYGTVLYEYYLLHELDDYFSDVV